MRIRSALNGAAALFAMSVAMTGVSYADHIQPHIVPCHGRVWYADSFGTVTLTQTRDDGQFRRGADSAGINSWRRERAAENSFIQRQLSRQPQSRASPPRSNGTTIRVALRTSTYRRRLSWPTAPGNFTGSVECTPQLTAMEDPLPHQ